ncbi:hypothetical protein PENSPDRAFT_750832 [Peniophora sp. CONT]|nr:hypothetical protein PENSPDRAFT_750832 [Peniophora sp. CONT]
MPFIDPHDHRTQLLLVAAGTAVATASVLSAYNAHTRRKKRTELSDSIKASLSRDVPDRPGQILPSASDFASSTAKAKGKQRADLGESLQEQEEEEEEAYAYDEDLIHEQLARNYAFFGEEAMAKVRKGKVVVVGCGGVGSWAAVMLARSGVSSIRLIDFDYVTLSSLNRHATARLADVGTPKVLCVARALSNIARFVDVDPRIELWRAGEGGEKLLEGADWVVDAIDNIQTKVDLLKYCAQNNIRVFSSMGAGAKADPTRVQIADLSATHYDPLARSVRQKLKAALGKDAANVEIPVVYSTEVPGEVSLLPLADEEFKKGKVDELAAFDDFRVRILPVIGPLPAIFGLHIASYIVCELAGKPLERPLPVRHRKKLYERLWKDLLHREQRIAGHELGTLPLSHADIALIFEDIATGRSIVPPYATCARAALVRWDPSQPLSTENCVVAEFKEAERAVREVFGVVEISRKQASDGSGNGESSGEDSGEMISMATSAASSGVLVPGGTNARIVDAKGDPLGVRPGARSPESVWGADAAKVAQKRIGEARKFREWALQ